jgi:hypothetical protein
MNAHFAPKLALGLVQAVIRPGQLLPGNLSALLLGFA